MSLSAGNEESFVLVYSLGAVLTFSFTAAVCLACSLYKMKRNLEWGTASCHLLNLTVSILLKLFPFLLISRVSGSMSNVFCWNYNGDLFSVSHLTAIYNISSPLILFLCVFVPTFINIASRATVMQMTSITLLKQIEEKNNSSSGCASLNGAPSEISLWRHRATVTKQSIINYVSICKCLTMKLMTQREHCTIILYFVSFSSF